jgi:hypothetical protein
MVEAYYARHQLPNELSEPGEGRSDVIGAQGTFYYFKCVRGSHAGDREGEVIEEGWVNNSSPNNPRPCSFKYPGDPDRECSNHINLDVNYCNEHIYEVYHLSFGLSGIANGGIGVYCGHKGDVAGKNAYFKKATRYANNGRVKEPGDVIGVYDGKLRSHDDISRQWDLWPLGELDESLMEKDGSQYYYKGRKIPDVTVPYGAIEMNRDKTTSVWDACIIRNVCAYINAHTPGLKANTEFVTNTPTQRTRIQTVKNIFDGEELLITYKPKGMRKVSGVETYWDTVSPKYIQYQTRAVTDGQVPDIQFGSAAEALQNFTRPRDRRTKIGRSQAPHNPPMKRKRPKKEGRRRSRRSEKEPRREVVYIAETDDEEEHDTETDDEDEDDDFVIPETDDEDEDSDFAIMKARIRKRKRKRNRTKIHIESTRKATKKRTKKANMKRTKKATKKRTKKATKKRPKKRPKKATKKRTKNATKKRTKKRTKKATKKRTKKATKKRTKKATKKRTKKATKKRTKKATKKRTKKATKKRKTRK